MSLVFAGGTASGKTTSMNAVSLFIPRKSKVVTIEDTREITLPHDNWIQSVTRESSTGEVKSNIGMSDLLGSALRQRPEYLLVGEIRNEPRVAETFFQAMATGHTSYTTFHADSVETVLSRFGNRPLNVPPQMLRELDIVAVQKQVFSDGKRVRRNTCVAELGVDGGGDEGVGRRDIYRRNASEDSFEHVGDSAKMREIREMRGWSEEDLRRRLEERTEVIRTLVENEVFDYDEVVDVIRRFDKKPEAVAEEAEDGNIV
jgi:flagellar protein FlaI